MRVDTKNNLSDSLYNDTQFLVQIDVMDYSLLVGFDDEKNEIIVGIVGNDIYVPCLAFIYHNSLYI